MTTLTLEIDNPSILTHLKAVLKAIHGVKILNVNNAASDENIDSEQPLLSNALYYWVSNFSYLLCIISLTYIS